MSRFPRCDAAFFQQWGGISGESRLFAGESGKSRKDGVCSSTEFSANRNCSGNLLIAKSPQPSHFDCEKLLFANRDMRHVVQFAAVSMKAAGHVG
jgi:hypothetical protein